MSRFLQNIEKYIAMAAFSIMVIMIIINVFSRYLFGRSFSSTEEISFIGFTYSVFFGICILYKKHALISIDVIVDKLPEAFRQRVIILNFALLTGVNLVLVYLSSKLTIDAWIRPTSALRIPYTFIYFPAVCAFAIMSAQSFVFLLEAVRRNKDIVQSPRTDTGPR